MKIKAIKYYLSSINTIIHCFSRWYTIPLLIFIHPLPFAIKNKGAYYADNLMDIWTLKEVLLDDCYKINKCKKLSTVIDIGASIGDFSLFVSSIAERVISCEFDKNRLHLLKNNILRAKVKNIIIIPNKITTLDSILKNGEHSYDLLKIDCEGSEYPILLNSRMSTLKKINRMIGELHFFNEKMKADYICLKKKLKDAGFTLLTWGNPVHNSICYFSATR